MNRRKCMLLFGATGLAALCSSPPPAAPTEREAALLASFAALPDVVRRDDPVSGLDFEYTLVLGWDGPMWGGYEEWNPAHSECLVLYRRGWLVQLTDDRLYFRISPAGRAVVQRFAGSKT